MISNTQQFIFIAVLVLFVFASGDASPECESWNEIKRTIEKIHFKHSVQCTVLKDCTGLECAGKYMGLNYNFSTIIDPCKEPTAIDLVVDIPKTHFRNFTHSLKDGDRYKLPEFTGIILAFKVYVDVALKERPDRKIIVGLDIKMGDDKPVVVLPNCTIVRAECMKNKILSLSKTAHGAAVTSSPMKMLNKSCSDNETCECHCKDGYVYNKDNVCKPIEKRVKKCDMSDADGCESNETCVQDSYNSPNGTCQPRSDGMEVCTVKSSLDDKTKSRTTIILAIVIPTCFLILTGVCLFLMVKHRVIHRLRDRFTNVRRYEVLSIGNDEEDDDDDEPLVVS